MAEVTINIKGMTCQGCVKAVTNALTRVSGVHKAEVSLEENKAVVSYEEQTVSVPALREAVEDAGYDVA